MHRKILPRMPPALAVVVALASGCAHYPVNAPMEFPDPHHGYRYWNLSHEGNSDEVFVCLTFSGGGGRAAALSYGVLKELRDTEIEVDGQRRRLLDEVDVISSVSGGSFTAAYYAVHHDGIFENYETDFLRHNYQRKIALSFLNPLQWPRYFSRNFSLTDRAAEIYDRGLFGGVTYGDLAQRSRPYLILNATDITQGRPFQFTQDQFDYLQSDLSSVPVARAVTASSAVPVVLYPVTLKAYHDQPNFAPAAWVTQQMASPDYPSLQWQLVAQLLYYSDPARCQYVHLVDGGISDNLGVTPLLLQRQQEANDLSIGQMIDREHVRHVAVIMVNAANRPDKDWTMRAHPPGAVAILNKAISGLMTNSTVAASRDLRLRAVTASADRPDVDFALIEIGFDNLPSEAERSFFENVATTLALSTETYDRLIQVGSRLLAENPEYQRFVAGLGGTILSSEPSQR